MQALSPTCAVAASSVPAGWSAPHTASCMSLCLFSLTLLPYPKQIPSSFPAKDSPYFYPLGLSLYGPWPWGQVML